MLYCNLVDDGIHVALDFVMSTQVALLKAIALTINASPAADPHTHGALHFNLMHQHFVDKVNDELA